MRAIITGVITNPQIKTEGPYVLMEPRPVLASGPEACIMKIGRACNHPPEELITGMIQIDNEKVKEPEEAPAE